LPDASGQFVFSLANNHIMDYGFPGLESTLSFLEKRAFKACGAGRNFLDARCPVVIEDDGIQVGIIACCEAQFGVAQRRKAGVAEFGPWVYRAIRDLRQTVDAVIVSIHASVEDSPWPSPFIRELCRSFIDAGASVVHGHHAHVPQGHEEYGEGLIFYGMGNLAVDADKWRNTPDGLWSLAAEIDLRSKPVRWRPLTLEIRYQSSTNILVIEESSGEEQERHHSYLQMCNQPLRDDALFEALWQEVALRAYEHYGAGYMGFSASPQYGRRAKIRKGLSAIKGALLNRSDKSRPSQYDHMLWYVMIACESHRQMLATALGILGGEIHDLRSDETRRLADELMPWSRKEVQL